MAAQSEPDGHIQYVTISNSRSIPLDFYLEPWGSTSVLPSKETFFVWSWAPKSDLIEIEFGEESVTVFAPHEAVVKVFHGETLVINAEEPFLGFPDKMTIRDLFNIVGMPRQEEFKETDVDPGSVRNDE